MITQTYLSRAGNTIVSCCLALNGDPNAARRANQGACYERVPGGAAAVAYKGLLAVLGHKTP